MMKKKSGLLTNNLFMIKEVINVIPFYVTVTFILTITGAIVNAYVNIYLVKYVIDSIQAAGSYKNVLEHILFALLIFILQIFFASTFNNIYVPRMKQILNNRMQLAQFRKAREIDIEKYDNPEFYNDFILSMQNADTKAIDVIDTVEALIYNITSVAAMITLIASIDMIGLIFALINVTAAYFLNIQTAKTNYKKNLELIPPKRVDDYVGRTFYLPEYAKEMRISNIKKVLHKYFINAIEENKSIIKKYGGKLTVLNFINHGFFRTFLMRGVYLIIIVYKLVVVKSITFGSFITLFNGSWEFKNSLEKIINIIPQMVENSLYIQKYRSFIETESEIQKCSGDARMPEQAKKIEFRNVSFRYTDDSPYVLKNINLIIHPGEKLAVYGLNGAGKSTLIKLLLRLYMVVEGEILLDGKNINSFNLKEYYNYIGVVFQDFQLFSFSIAENILLDKYDPADEQRIVEAINRVYFDDRLKREKKGTATIVSKEFDMYGVNFSGGEKQKIALARTIVKNFPIVIYDEPASALDPISEYEVNKAIWESARDKTVICISHRINANVKADRTIYMRDGQIVEDEELKAIYL